MHRCAWSKPIRSLHAPAPPAPLRPPPHTLPSLQAGAGRTDGRVISVKRLARKQAQRTPFTIAAQHKLLVALRALLLAGGLCLPVIGLATGLDTPTFDEVKQDFTSSESFLLDRHGEVIHRLRINPHERRGEWVALADISPALRLAILLSEDKRFYEHSGVDWRAVSAAAWGNLWNEKTRGASTISMQLVGLIDEDLRQGRRGRTLLQKFGQAAAARLLDGRWRKDQILEAYLNLVPFRGDTVGIDALSRSLFNKAAHGLDAREAALAAALVRSPNAPVKTVSRRACLLLAQMRQTATGKEDRDAPASPDKTETAQTGKSSGNDDDPGCGKLHLFAASAMQHRRWAPSEGIAPHLARRLLTEGAPGTRLRSALSAPLQRLATAELHRQLRELAGRHVQDGAVLVLDNESGETLAWVGSSGLLSSAPDLDFVTAPRQPGSTLKPFLYAQAIAEKRLTAASLLDDSPAVIATSGGLYIPQNYDRHFRGWVSVRQALAASLNVPAVRAIGMVGVNPFARQLGRLGIALPHPGDYYGYSLALGSPEISLLHMTNAYRALANGGRYSNIRLQPAGDSAASGRAITPQAARAPEKPDSPNTPAVMPEAAFIVGQLLSDNNARIPTFGVNSLLRTPFWSAVKTGTSKDMRDNWAIGWSRRYTVGVWVGNARGDPMHRVSGVSGAAPVWAAIMRYLHRATPSLPPAPPAGVVSAPVRFSLPPERTGTGAPTDTAIEPPRNEWFIAGTQQAVFAAPAHAQQAAGADGAGEPAGRIEAPADGTILALDPDIPPKRQRLLLRANIGNGQWKIDGKPVGHGHTQAWLPLPGRHRIELYSRRGALLDTVRIEVRGAFAVADAPRSR